MEHPHGVLYQDVFFIVIEAFHTAAIRAVADFAAAFGFYLVAIRFGVSSFIVGIHGFAVCG